MDPLDTFVALVRAETRLWNGLDRALTAAGHPSLARTDVMRAVAATPDCRVGDVAEALDITHGGVSKLVDRLVASGHVARGRHPTDGRASVLALTPAGRSALAAAEDAARAWLAPRLAAARSARSLDAHLTQITTAPATPGEAP